MDEKKDALVNQILKEAKQRAAQQRNAGESVRSPRSGEEFDLFFQNLTGELRANKYGASNQEVLPPASEQKLVKVAPVEPAVASGVITRSPETADVPQSKKRLKTIDEVVGEIAPEQVQNKIDKAIANQNGEQPAEKEKELTRTGVIRKAEALIEEPASPVTVDRMGNPKLTERVVGEKEDMQTKAYNAYIRAKKSRDGDTGIVKKKEIKPVPKEDVTKTRVVARPAKERKQYAQDIPGSQENAEQKHSYSLSGYTLPHEGESSAGIQITMEGFENEPVRETVTMEELERQAELSQQYKRDTFELKSEVKTRFGEAVAAQTKSRLNDTYAPEKETPVISEVLDYNYPTDSRAIFRELEQMSGRFKLRVNLNIIGACLIAVIGIFGSGILSDFGLGTAGEGVYIILNAAVLLCLIVLNIRAVFKGLKALFTLKPGADSMVAVAALAALAQCAVAYFFGEDGAGVSALYTGAASVLFLLNCIGKRSLARRVLKNFGFLTRGEGKNYSSAAICEPKEIAEFTKSDGEEYHDIRYNVKTEFATRFLANSFADDPADTIAKYATYPLLAAALLAAVVLFFITKDIVVAVSALSAFVIVGTPASSVMAFQKALENTDAALQSDRGTICGFAALEDIAETTEVVLCAEDLFPRGACKLSGLQIFHGMKPDMAILYAASILEKTKHPLRHELMESVQSDRDRMPRAFNVQYETKLGIHALIFDRTVLLGSKEMMLTHGIEIPEKARPDTYNKENARVLFLAIDGLVCAMFLVHYYAYDTIVEQLQYMEESGIRLLVKTEDSNIDAELLNEIFQTDPENVTVLSALANRMYEEKTARPVYNEAQLINRGDAMTFLKGILACKRLSRQIRTLRIVLYISIIFGFLLAAAAIFANTFAGVSALLLVAYQALWMIITNVYPRVVKAV